MLRPLCLVSQQRTWLCFSCCCRTITIHKFRPNSFPWSVVHRICYLYESWPFDKCPLWIKFRMMVTKTVCVSLTIAKQFLSFKKKKNIRTWYQMSFNINKNYRHLTDTRNQGKRNRQISSCIQLHTHPKKKTPPQNTLAH